MTGNTADLENEILMLRDALDDACGGQETRLRLMLESRERELAALRASRGDGFRYPQAKWSARR